MLRHALAVAALAVATLAASPAVAGPTATTHKVVTSVALGEPSLDATAKDLSTKLAAKTLDAIITAAGAKAVVRRLDLSVTKLQLDPLSYPMRVVAEIRIAVSDERGKLLCVLSGGASVESPTTAYHARQLPQMRADALAAAVQGMRGKLLASITRP